MCGTRYTLFGDAPLLGPSQASSLPLLLRPHKGTEKQDLGELHHKKQKQSTSLRFSCQRHSHGICCQTLAATVDLSSEAAGAPFGVRRLKQ